MKSTKFNGLVMASAVVGLLASGVVLAGGEKGAAEGQKTVKCAGINSCSGHGECAAADGSHGCAGKNTCKGKGWVKAASEKECTDKGGKVIKEEAKKS
jgi:hypothetical protein